MSQNRVDALLTAMDPTLKDLGERIMQRYGEIKEQDGTAKALEEWARFNIMSGALIQSTLSATDQEIYDAVSQETLRWASRQEINEGIGELEGIMDQVRNGLHVVPPGGERP